MSAVEDELARVAHALSLRSRGLFIAFEGGDGSGKTTQLKRLGGALTNLGAPVRTTFEPGGTELGQELRRLLMHGPDDIDPHTEALLYAADRAYHVNTVVKPALAAGTTVLTDRYIDSSAAYQGLGRGLGVEDIRGLSLWGAAGLLPDAVIVLDTDPQVGLGRLGRELDRLENAGDQFHEQVGAYYRSAAEESPEYYYLIDAARSRDETFAEVVAAALAVTERAGP